MSFNYYYSSDPQAFYDAGLSGGLPDTKLHGISDTDYFNFMLQPPGKMGVWVDGHPVLVDVSPPDYSAINGTTQEALVAEAMAPLTVITTKINMGRTVTQAEKARVNAVLDYIDELNATDLSVPTPQWPPKPN